MVRKRCVIGESDNTHWKNESVSALFRAWCRQVGSIISRTGNARRCLLADLTAGNGWNSVDSEPTFLANARAIGMDCGLEIEIYAFDSCLRNIETLEERGCADVTVCGKWQDSFEVIERAAKNAFSFVYHDPNSGYIQEHRDVIRLAECCSKADFCLHIDAKQIIRIRKAGIEINELTDLVCTRRECVIREPFSVTNSTGMSCSEWTILYLSNCAMNGYSKYGFHKLGDGETGEEILQRLRMTKQEFLTSPPRGQKRLFV